MKVNKYVEYSTFEEPFKLINSKYRWFRLYLGTVHEEYRNFVIQELIKSLTFHRITPEEFHSTKRNLEKTLKIKIEFENALENNELQKNKSNRFDEHRNI